MSKVVYRAISVLAVILKGRYNRYNVYFHFVDERSGAQEVE